MADDDGLEGRIERLRHWAQSQHEMFREGDTFLLRYGGGEVDVEEMPLARFRTEYPRLYGRLISIEAQLDNGCLLYVLALLGAGAACLGLRQGWWEPLLGADLAAELNTWWFYPVLFVVAFVAASAAYEWGRRRVYRRHRRELLDLLRADGLDRDTLLPLLEGAEGLDAVTQQLKLDPGPFPSAEDLP